MEREPLRVFSQAILIAAGKTKRNTKRQKFTVLALQYAAFPGFFFSRVSVRSVVAFDTCSYSYSNPFHRTVVSRYTLTLLFPRCFLLVEKREYIAGLILGYENSAKRRKKESGPSNDDNNGKGDDNY